MNRMGYSSDLYVLYSHVDFGSSAYYTQTLGYRCGVPLCTVVDHDLGWHRPKLVFLRNAG
jgi:hypothetical protein